MAIRIQYPRLMSQKRKTNFYFKNFALIFFLFSGALLASGQISHMGFRAYVIIWNWEDKKEKGRHEIHKGRVEALSFTCNEHFLISLGGRDDRMLAIWDVESGTAITATRAVSETSGEATRVKTLQRRSSVFISGGDRKLIFYC